MALEFRKYSDSDLVAMQRIWNEVVCAGDAFPGEQPLSLQECRSYFAAQTCTTLAVLGGRVVGLYILHPNNIGRAAHIANASYAVDSAVRGQHVGEGLVRHCLSQLAGYGFTGLQFNAVVATNAVAIKLYKKLGFVQVGTVPGGFRLPGDIYCDFYFYFHPVLPVQQET